MLATPLTVCLVVMGKRVPALELLGTLMSDAPALTIEASFYQRLLAGDQADDQPVGRSKNRVEGWRARLDQDPCKRSYSLVLERHQGERLRRRVRFRKHAQVNYERK